MPRLEYKLASGDKAKIEMLRAVLFKHTSKVSVYDHGFGCDIYAFFIYKENAEKAKKEIDDRFGF